MRFFWHWYNLYLDRLCCLADCARLSVFQYSSVGLTRLCFQPGRAGGRGAEHNSKDYSVGEKHAVVMPVLIRVENCTEFILSLGQCDSSYGTKRDDVVG